MISLIVNGRPIESKDGTYRIQHPKWGSWWILVRSESADVELYCDDEPTTRVAMIGGRESHDA